MLARLRGGAGRSGPGGGVGLGRSPGAGGREEPAGNGGGAGRGRGSPGGLAGLEAGGELLTRGSVGASRGPGGAATRFL